MLATLSNLSVEIIAGKSLHIGQNVNSQETRMQGSSGGIEPRQVPKSKERHGRAPVSAQLPAAFLSFFGLIDRATEGFGTLPANSIEAFNSDWVLGLDEKNAYT
jgi:hypothetical protein